MSDWMGDEEYIYLNTEALVDVALGSLGAQGSPHELRWAVERVVREHGGAIETQEALDDLLLCFVPPHLRPERTRNIPLSVRQAVVRRDGEACVICGSDDDPCLDHIKPFSRGGRHTVSNLRVLCRACNSSKGDKTDGEWLGGCGG